jgi:hypothetical protein
MIQYLFAILHNSIRETKQNSIEHPRRTIVERIRANESHILPASALAQCLRPSQHAFGNIDTKNVAIRSDCILKIWEVSSSSATNLKNGVALSELKLSNRPTADSSRKPEDPFEQTIPRS